MAKRQLNQGSKEQKKGAVRSKTAPRKGFASRPATPRKISSTQSTLLMIGAAVLVLLVIFAGVSLLRSAQASVANAGAAGLPPEVTVAEALEKREAGAFILDVREPSEWEDAHIPGATLIPLGQLASRLDEVPKDQEVVVVCRSGNRSAEGRDILLRSGFEKVTSMAGGMNQWKAARNPTVSGP
jgi:rhodanese-related sulfurtransferase